MHDLHLEEPTQDAILHERKRAAARPNPTGPRFHRLDSRTSEPKIGTDLHKRFRFP